ncbi:MAG: PIN domain-containing protein, partial [Desulfobulbaceae bacterium]|nr:PIN domain-containing protein [Desulfobulbaceae bacterium]
MKKHFVLDTNVLLHNAEAISSFADNIVVLPMSVIEELDKFKSRNDELGRNARKVIRNLDLLRTKGPLGKGVKMENGGILKIYTESKTNLTNPGLDLGVADNRILSVAFTLLEKGDTVIFVSKDINARLKADALGIGVMDFEKQKINFDELFTGQREVLVPEQTIKDYYKQELITIEEQEFMPNEFAVLTSNEDEKVTALAKAINNHDLVHLAPKMETIWGIHARSREQRMAFELLMDPGIELVTLVGQAGTGKTLLALAAGLESTIKFKRYDRLLVSRPIIPLGKDIGYLPGDKDEKLSHWMQPIFDNLTYLLRDGNKNKEDEETVRQKVEKLLKTNIIELEALTYIRGRSIS